MAEDYEDARRFGTRCLHGTNVGTPGGMDLMCGLCENGLTRWYPDPMYGLQMRLLSAAPEMEWWPPLQHISIQQTAVWRESNLSGPNACMTMRRKLSAWSEMFETEGELNTLEYRVLQVDEGYWGEPS